MMDKKMFSFLDQMQNLNESIGDNTVDNIVDELARCVSVELDLFVIDLLGKMVTEFTRDYHLPFYEDFKTSFSLVLNRYQLMSGDEEGDLFKKIDNFFLNIFSEKFSAAGHEVSDVIAKKFSTQMIKFLKTNKVQANVDMAVDKTDTYY
jgi:hypothetical protein